MKIEKCRELLGIVGNCREFVGIVGYCRELSGIVGNCRELLGIVGNCRELSVRAHSQKVYLEMGKKVYENNGNWEIITKIKKIPIRKRNWQMVDKKKAVCKTARRAHSQKKAKHAENHLVSK